MRYKYLWVFLAMQLIGILATIEAVLFQFGSLLIVAWVFLLPGSLPFAIPVVAKSFEDLLPHWFLWMACVGAFTINALLFAAVSALHAKRGKST